MSFNDGGHGTTRDESASQGPYILRKLLARVPLSDGSADDAKGLHITCVEFWAGNLYVGTSAGELVHFVALPDDDGATTWIQGSRLPLVADDDALWHGVDRSVQQILILPTITKAFILCNGMIKAYSLPELTPAFASTRLTNCTWIGGLDLEEQAAPQNPVIVICQRGKLRLVRVGDRMTKVRDIDYGGCLCVVRRGDIACVADRDDYSLLDVVEQQRIPLFPVASEAQTDPPQAAAAVVPDHASDAVEEDHTATSGAPRVSTIEPDQSAPIIGTEPTAADHADTVSPLALVAGGTFPPRTSSVAQTSAGTSDPSMTLSQSRVPLRPVIASPNSTEFLLATGTSMYEPGLGMFINTDGELTPRGTIEFSSYPVSICVDGTGIDLSGSRDANVQQTGGYVLAIVSREKDQSRGRAVQIRRWDLDATEPSNKVHWLDLDASLAERGDSSPIGARKLEHSGSRMTTDDLDCSIKEIVDLLCPFPLELSHILSGQALSVDERNLTRMTEREHAEAQLYQTMATSQTKLVAWADDCIWCISRNPLVLSSEARLAESLKLEASHLIVNRSAVENVLNDIRDIEPNSGLEFYSLNYIRQKASIILFVDLLVNASRNFVLCGRDRRATAEALSRGDFDPRVLLSMIPDLSQEIVEGPEGIWVQRGLKGLLDSVLSTGHHSVKLISQGESGLQLLQMAKQYLLLWRKKKGLESVTDKDQVFASVDAALLRLLLALDADSPPGPGRKGSVRAELNVLIEGGIDCFERAVALLEEFRRPYVLSWLYETRKMPREVLSTWRRIIEGAEDIGGELGDGGETKLRRYLARIDDRELVREYGTWLARRNPALGMRVFADAHGRVTFSPKESVEILKQDAPGAVKIFLEHLVFENNLAAYATDLISYYLDSVVGALESQGTAHTLLQSSYQAYRALKVPKPTYGQFAEDQDIDADWWRNRLRLLQLLGGSHGAASQYDVPGMLRRIVPYEQELVPEMIVLAGKQGQHGAAIKLLVHGLGDFDTAVSYCLLGGSSTYSPLSGSLPKESAPSRLEQETLFTHLLEEFLALEHAEDQIAQTGELLERFAGWLDPIHVISLLPETWSVDVVSGFLETSLRHLVSERNETAITKALLNADNLAANYSLIEKLEGVLPRLQSVGVGQL